MAIKFIYNHTKKTDLTFGDVPCSQFFVFDGKLFQKVSRWCANQFTTRAGVLYAEPYVRFNSEEIIDKMFPDIILIGWE